MRYAIAAASLIVFLALAGCLPVQSLHPLCSDKDVVLEPALLGAWTDPGEKDNQATWTFSQSKNHSYVLVINAPQESYQLKFTLHLVRLNKSLFLDAELDGISVKGEDVGALIFAAPIHTIYRLQIKEGELRLQSLDDDWLKKALAAQTVQIPHETLASGTILLTAPTAEVQDLVIKHADDKNAFMGDTNLVRAKQ